MERPTFEEFKNNLSTFFREPLTSKAEMIAFNFWTNWQEIINHVESRKLRIALPSSVLDNYVSKNYPRYKMFKKIKNASIITLPIVVIFSFGLAIKFTMPEAIIFTALVITPAALAGMLPYSYMEVTKFAHGRNLLNKIEIGIESDEPTRGMMNLCATYISGQIGLQTENGIAFWPDYPAVAL
ncbi:MAG: hypothetical protein JRE40_15365 [Deltaproteobacteria bacterium]|nr:hypothetical protein [Deltaproteobacteria bacterium]